MLQQTEGLSQKMPLLHFWLNCPKIEPYNLITGFTGLTYKKQKVCAQGRMGQNPLPSGIALLR